MFSLEVQKMFSHKGLKWSNLRVKNALTWGSKNVLTWESKNALTWELKNALTWESKNRGWKMLSLES